MRKVLIFIYSLFSIIAFISLCGITGFLFYSHYTLNMADFENRLTYIKNDIRTWYEEFQSFDSGLFRTGMRNILKNEDHLFLITLYSPGKGVIYTIEKRAKDRASFLKSKILSDLREKDPEWEGIPVYRDLPIIRTTVTNKLMDTPMVYIEVMFYPFLKTEIAGLLKWGFLSLILWLMVTILIRLFAVSGPDSRIITNPVNSEMEDNEKEYSDPPEDSLSRKTEDKSYYYDNHPETDTPEFDAGEQSRAGIQQLFSPQTGLGWKEHLVQRLGFEINRTASFNQDMVLGFISIDNFDELSSGSDVYIRIAKIILNTFPFQDLAFEYGKGKYGIILPDSDLQEGIKNLDIFQKKITGKVLYHQAVTVSIGLSSRNGRLLSSETFMQEAQRALEKASGEGRGRIIAFKADPEKYRNSLSKKQSQV